MMDQQKTAAVVHKTLTMPPCKTMMTSTTTSMMDDDQESILIKEIDRSRNFLYVLGTLLALMLGGFTVGYMLIATGRANAALLELNSNVALPELFLCPDQPYRSEYVSIDKEKSPMKDQDSQPMSRMARQLAEQLRRVYRPLSPAPRHGWDFTQEPSLYHDVGARCSWIDLPGRRVDGLEQLSYDFQILELINCTNPGDCRAICMRMHKPNDPNLCNYIIMNRVKKVALFYNIDPFVNWNISQDPTSDSSYWKCTSVPCDWSWRRRQKLSMISLSDLEDRLVLKTQCKEFATCQRLCETHSTCNYIVMPRDRKSGQPSFLYSVPNRVFDQKNFIIDEDHDSFEMTCRDGSVQVPVSHGHPPSAQEVTSSHPVQTSQSPVPIPPPSQQPQTTLIGQAPGAQSQPRDFDIFDPKSVPQQQHRNKRSLCLNGHGCDTKSAILETCQVNDQIVPCHKISRSLSNAQSESKCLMVSLTANDDGRNPEHSTVSSESTIHMSLIFRSGPISGMWLTSIRGNQRRMKNDLFVDGHASKNELDLDVNGDGRDVRASKMALKTSYDNQGRFSIDLRIWNQPRTPNGEFVSKLQCPAVFCVAVLVVLAVFVYAAHALLKFVQS